MLNEILVSQSQKDKYGMVLLICGPWNRQARRARKWKSSYQRAEERGMESYCLMSIAFLLE